ncbi:unnamed protein product [Brassicogethes aeneus]|uniref:Tetraspanin n=1 Tax=Brassicogethes aeneus TaxID=1431903 RepID=A0A9P0FKN9_BRAAE|nr:unnamed protein product [Brassicogethes aeneus]
MVLSTLQGGWKKLGRGSGGFMDNAESNYLNSKMMGASIFALCLWLRLENGIQEWLYKLHADHFYDGVYVLIIASLLIMAVSFLGCVTALAESSFLTLMYIASQVLGFIFSLAGAAVLLDYSARNSRFQPQVRETMRGLIMNAHHEESRQTLAMIQENIACCGADGANDFLSLNQPLPSECRDTVTGNPFYHGCVDELTWFFEEKCGGIAGLAMAVCLFHVTLTSKQQDASRRRGVCNTTFSIFQQFFINLEDISCRRSVVEKSLRGIAFVVSSPSFGMSMRNPSSLQNFS